MSLPKLSETWNWFLKCYVYDSINNSIFYSNVITTLNTILVAFTSKKLQMFRIILIISFFLIPIWCQRQNSYGQLGNNHNKIICLYFVLPFLVSWVSCFCTCTYEHNLKKTNDNDILNFTLCFTNYYPSFVGKLICVLI